MREYEASIGVSWYTIFFTLVHQCIGIFVISLFNSNWYILTCFIPLPLFGSYLNNRKKNSITYNHAIQPVLRLQSFLKSFANSFHIPPYDSKFAANSLNSTCFAKLPFLRTICLKANSYGVVPNPANIGEEDAAQAFGWSIVGGQ